VDFQSQLIGILLSQSEGLSTLIDGKHIGCWMMMLNCERDGTAAGSEVGYNWSRLTLNCFQCPVNQCFCIWSGI